MNISILMVDDHLAILEGYELLLSYHPDKPTIKTKKITSLQEANEFIHNERKFKHIDIAIIDLSIPAYPEAKLMDGKDLAIKIKQLNPKIKILIVTSYSEPLLLYKIYNVVKPNGILIKSELDGNALHNALSALKSNKIYNSEAVTIGFEKIEKHTKKFDELDLDMILYLYQGVKTKYLPEKLNLNISTINHRKKAIKEVFKVEYGGDEDIVNKAKSLGIL